MVARGELRNDAAVVGVHRDLGVQGVGEQPASGVVEGDAGLVAGGFDTEDDHGKDWAEAGEGFASARDFADIIRALFRQRSFRFAKWWLMPTVRVKENEPFEVALRRFKRTVEKTGLLTELRAREFYEKPTSERKRKLAAAVKRHHKRLRSQLLPPKMY